MSGSTNAGSEREIGTYAPYTPPPSGDLAGIWRSLTALWHGVPALLWLHSTNTYLPMLGSTTRVLCPLSILPLGTYNI